MYYSSELEDEVKALLEKCGSLEPRKGYLFYKHVTNQNLTFSQVIGIQSPVQKWKTDGTALFCYKVVDKKKIHEQCVPLRKFINPSLYLFGFYGVKCCVNGANEYRLGFAFNDCEDELKSCGCPLGGYASNYTHGTETYSTKNTTTTNYTSSSSNYTSTTAPTYPAKNTTASYPVGYTAGSTGSSQGASTGNSATSGKPSTTGPSSSSGSAQTSGNTTPSTGSSQQASTTGSSPTTPTTPSAPSTTGTSHQASTTGQSQTTPTTPSAPSTTGTSHQASTTGSSPTTPTTPSAPSTTGSNTNSGSTTGKGTTTGKGKGNGSGKGKGNGKRTKKPTAPTPAPQASVAPTPTPYYTIPSSLINNDVSPRENTDDTGKNDPPRSSQDSSVTAATPYYKTPLFIGLVSAGCVVAAGAIVATVLLVRKFAKPPRVMNYELIDNEGDLAEPLVENQYN